MPLISSPSTVAAPRRDGRALSERAAERPGQAGRPILAPVELQLETFQGPLELLLALVEKRKLPITAVSLAAVADQYLAYLRNLPTLDPDLLADFLLVAARLLLIKSQALLPGQAMEAPEEEDPAEELAARLQEYQLIRAVASYLQQLEQRGQRCYPHPPRLLPIPTEVPLAPLRPDELAAALRSLLARRQRASPPAELARLVRVTVESRIALIQDLLATSEVVEWGQIGGRSIDEAVATFLALLELLKRGLVHVEQAEPFAPIRVRRPSPQAALSP